MAQFPNSVPSFTTKHNITDVVDENDPNSIQAEVVAIGQELGTNPRISTARSTTYATVDARLEAIETDYRLTSVPIAHGATTGLAGDDHTQYTKVDGTRAFTGSTAITAAPVAVQAGDTQSQGALHTLSRSDHRHAVAAATTPGNSAVGHSASVGASAAFARADHQHGREGFAAVTAETAFGQASSDGVAVTLARSDHTHGTPALATTAASNQAIGDAATIGSGTKAAKDDHKHGMPAFSSSVSDETTYSLTPNAGSAATISRGDHTHGSPSASLTGPSGIVAMWPTASPPGGWLLCDGTAVSRATYSVLFGIIGTTYGAGNGSTTFNLPDYRGRVPIGAGTGTGGGSSGTGAPTGGSALTARALAGWSGAETHVLITAELAQHSHTQGTHQHSGSSVPSGGVGAHRHNVNHGHGFNDPGHTHQFGNRNPQTVFDGIGDLLVSRGDATSTVVDYNRGSPNGRDIITYVQILSGGTGAWISDNNFNSGYEIDSLSHGHSVSIVAEGPTTNQTGSNTAHNNMQPVLGINFIIKT